MMWQLGLLTTITWIISLTILAYYQTKSQKYKPEEAVKQEINKIAEQHGTQIKKVKIKKPETIQQTLKQKKELQKKIDKKEEKLQKLQKQLEKQENKKISEKKEKNKLRKIASKLKP